MALSILKYCTKITGRYKPHSTLLYFGEKTCAYASPSSSSFSRPVADWQADTG